MTVVDQIQTWLALGCLPVSTAFIVLFGRKSERWWRTEFGVSLMLVAVAIFFSGLATALYRIYGPDYPLRDPLRLSAQALALVAMLLRTRVLARAQWHDYRSGRNTFWLFRLIDRLRRNR